MITSNDCLKKWGKPDGKTNMCMMEISSNIKVFPRKIFCNKALVEPLKKALDNIVKQGLTSELHTYYGCFNIRVKRGGTTYSLHSWGVAIDVNASTNAFGAKPTLSAMFVKCFTDAGFDWGGTWAGKPDGMHFQLKII